MKQGYKAQFIFSLQGVRKVFESGLPRGRQAEARAEVDQAQFHAFEALEHGLRASAAREFYIAARGRLRPHHDPPSVCRGPSLIANKKRKNFMSTTSSISYGNLVKTDLGQDEAIERTKAFLKEEGFGVLSEIDVAATLKEKIGADVPAYRILGACNPQFAHQALTLEPQLGLLLPCNVVVQQSGGTTVVSTIDARALLGVVKNDDMLGVADEVNSCLARVLDRIAKA